MQRIGLISNDQRLPSELKRWLGEIFDEFEIETLGPPTTGDPPPTEPTTSSSQELPEPPAPITLVLFDASLGAPHANQWTLSRFRDELKLTGIPWLAIGPESLAMTPHAPLIDGADDLVLAPLDRSVLLQKIEYLMAQGASVQPSFLYLAKTEFPIELGKPITLTHISETGCTILSPRPLALGVEGTLLSKVFGEGENQQVEIRAIESVPHFEYSAQGERQAFEVRLRFFGLRHEQLKNLRKSILKTNSDGQSDSLLRSEGEPAERLHIALLSHDSTLGTRLRSSLEDLTQTDIDEFRGLKHFYASLLKRKTPQTEGAQAADAKPLWSVLHSPAFIGPKTLRDTIPALPRDKVVILYRHLEETVEKIIPQLQSGETVLGVDRDAWTRDASPLTRGLAANDREALIDAINWIAESHDSAPKTDITAEYDVSPAIRTRLTYHLRREEKATPAKGALIRIELEASAEPADTLVAPTKHYECILVDGSLLTMDARDRILQIENWLETFDLKNAFGNRPPLVVFNANESVLTARQFRSTKVRQLAYDFDDRKFQAELFISLSRPELWTSPQLNVASLKSEISAFLMRPAKAEAVSEVGIVVTDRVAMKRGTELLVLSPLWPSAKDGLWARLRSASSKGEGQFANEFIFLGAGDLVQKEIRRFAREDYVRKKAQGG